MRSVDDMLEAIQSDAIMNDVHVKQVIYFFLFLFCAYIAFSAIFQIQQNIQTSFLKVINCDILVAFHLI